ncbi:hypothetical protein DFQ29_001512 [Apophysomyces sp. BC1021]|nr:hypothetical protein DFQ29_001512 [Apophysomyces sp. BC1021]
MAIAAIVAVINMAVAVVHAAIPNEQQKNAMAQKRQRNEVKLGYQLGNKVTDIYAENYKREIPGGDQAADDEDMDEIVLDEIGLGDEDMEDGDEGEDEGEDGDDEDDDEDGDMNEEEDIGDEELEESIDDADDEGEDIGDEEIFDDGIADDEEEREFSMYQTEDDDQSDGQNLPPLVHDNVLQKAPEDENVTSATVSSSPTPVKARVNNRLLVQEEQAVVDFEKKINTSLEHAFNSAAVNKLSSWSDDANDMLIAPLEVDDSIFEESSPKTTIQIIVILCILIYILLKIGKRQLAIKRNPSLPVI